MKMSKSSMGKTADRIQSTSYAGHNDGSGSSVQSIDKVGRVQGNYGQGKGMKKKTAFTSKDY